MNVTASAYIAAITPKTRLLLINSPCNPTGAAYTRAEWRALADVLLQHPRVIVGTDDMYEKIWWGPEPFSSLLTVAPELYDRVVTINGVSKSYAMTGWRCGWALGPAEVVAACNALQSHSTSNVSSISQKAALAAAQEERFTRRRHDAAFPAQAIRFCLERAGVSADAIDYVKAHSKA